MLQESPMYAYIPASDLSRARRSTKRSSASCRRRRSPAGSCTNSPVAPPCFLYPTPNAGTSQSSQAFWAVQDVDREIEQLKARGVVFEDYDMPGERDAAGAVIAGGAKAAWFKDSEGNIMAIIESVAGG